VHELRSDFPVVRLLKVAQLPKSSFYYWDAARTAADKYKDVKDCLATLYERHRGRYGYQRMTAALARAGHHLNPKTVLRLLGELGLKSRQRRAKKYNSHRGEVGRTAPNILKRKFQADEPSKKWVTDITEFSVAGKKLYLSPVLDLHNGEIVTFTMGERPVFDLVKQMVLKALRKLKPGERPMLHSDQGWQYQMPCYRSMLSNRQLVQSMSRKGNCHDNASMESFFAVLKSEFFHLNEFTSIEQLKRGIKKYIHYYNHERIKHGLGWLSPVQYRNQPSSA